MRAHLKQEAEANFRSLTQEALVRIEPSFRMEEAFNDVAPGAIRARGTALLRRYSLVLWIEQSL